MLNEGDGAGGSLLAFDVRLIDEERIDDMMDDLQHRRQQLRMHGKQTAQRNRERQHLLAHRYARDDALHQIHGSRGHAPRAA